MWSEILGVKGGGNAAGEVAIFSTLSHWKTLRVVDCWCDKGKWVSCEENLFGWIYLNFLIGFCMSKVGVQSFFQLNNLFLQWDLPWKMFITKNITLLTAIWSVCLLVKFVGLQVCKIKLKRLCAEILWCSLPILLGAIKQYDLKHFRTGAKTSHLLWLMWLRN